MSDYESHELDIDDSLSTEAVADGVIRNVLLVGKVSKNGYSYTPESYGDGSQFDSVPVFLSHNQRGKNPLDRPVHHVVGVVRNPRVTAEGVRGDVEITDTEPGRTLLALAKTNLRRGLMGFSLTGKYVMNGAKTVVEKISEILSVDLVLGPATTQTVFESQNTETEEDALMVQELKTSIQGLKAEIESLKADLAGKPKRESRNGDHTQVVKERKPLGKGRHWAEEAGLGADAVEAIKAKETESEYMRKKHHFPAFGTEYIDGGEYVFDYSSL